MKLSLKHWNAPKQSRLHFVRICFGADTHTHTRYSFIFLFSLLRCSSSSRTKKCREFYLSNCRSEQTNEKNEQNILATDEMARINRVWKEQSRTFYVSDKFLACTIFFLFCSTLFLALFSLRHEHELWITYYIFRLVCAFFFHTHNFPLNSFVISSRSIFFTIRWIFRFGFGSTKWILPIIYAFLFDSL